MMVGWVEMLQFIYGFYGSGLVVSMGPYMVVVTPLIIALNFSLSVLC